MSLKLIDAEREYPLKQYGRLSEDVKVWIERYLDAAKRHSVKTEKAYKEALKPFHDFCMLYEDQGLDEVGPLFINHYIVYYIKELGEFFRGNRVILGKRNRQGEQCLRDSPDTLDDEVYEKILTNDGRSFNRAYDNIYVPERFAKTVLHRVTTLKQLLKYITNNSREHHDFSHFFDRIATIKADKGGSTFLMTAKLKIFRDVCLTWPDTYREQVQRISSASRRRSVSRYSDYAARRNAFILLLISYSGLRASEALNLEFKQFRNAEVNEAVHRFYSLQIRGKGNKRRMVPVPAEKIDPLLRLLPVERNVKISANEQNDKTISYAALLQYSAQLYRAAGIEERGLHMLRRSFATEFMLHSDDIGTLAKYLGHRSIQMTHELYVQNNPELLMRKNVYLSDTLGINQ